MPTKTRNKSGPKPKIGDAERAKILLNLRAGASISDCAGLIGVDRKTIQNAMKADKGFSAGVKEARRVGKMRQLKKITKSKDWKAAAWYLERVYGSEFGRRDRVEHTGKDGAPVETVTTHKFDHDRFSDLFIRNRATGIARNGNGAAASDRN